MPSADLLRSGVHVVHVLLCAYKGTWTVYSNLTSCGVFDADQKNFLVSSRNVWKSVFSTSLDVKGKDSNLIDIILHILFRILLKDILIEETSLTTDLKVRKLFVSLNKLFCVPNSTLLDRANVLPSNVFQVSFFWEGRYRIELNTIFKG